MQILVISNDSQKNELTGGIDNIPANIYFTHSINSASSFSAAEVIIDLLFDEDPQGHTAILKHCLQSVIIVNHVAGTLAGLPAGMIRINGWNGFLIRNLIEAAGAENMAKAEEAFSLFKKKLEWVPDQPGFISCRVIAMIINEAYLALHEGVSSREEINTAMKLGTNYPFGPFEWADQIGLDKVRSLLNNMAQQDSKYSPASNI